MDQIITTKNEIRAAQWTRLIQDCQSSGMTVISWCESHGINIKTYYYWLRKLRAAAIEQSGLPALKDETRPASFKKLEVQPPVTGTQAAVIIHLPSATLEIQNGASQQTVEAVLLALKSIC